RSGRQRSDSTVPSLTALSFSKPRFAVVTASFTLLFFFAWPPPSSAMNSRRFIMAPVLRHKIAHIGTAGDAVGRDFDRTNDRLWVISERNVPLRLCPLYPGEFNRSVQHQLQSIGRGFEGQGLSRALIEPQSNAIEVGLGEAREIGSSREVLSQQAVGVLVAATLPWTARITEVNLHVGGNREAFVARHLLALVPRQGAS